jgi:hypothetical protein
MHIPEHIFFRNREVLPGKDVGLAKSVGAPNEFGVPNEKFFPAKMWDWQRA